MRKSSANVAYEDAGSPELRAKIHDLKETNLRLYDQYLQKSAVRYNSLGYQLAAVLFANYYLEDRICVAQQYNDILRAQLRYAPQYLSTQSQAQDYQLKALKTRSSSIAKHIAQVDERIFLLQNNIKPLRSKLEFETDIPYGQITSAFVGRAVRLAELRKELSLAGDESSNTQSHAFQLSDQQTKPKEQNPEEIRLRVQICEMQRETAFRRTRSARMQSRIEALISQKRRLSTSLQQAYFAGKWLHIAIHEMRQLLAPDCEQSDGANSVADSKKYLPCSLPEPMCALALKLARLRLTLLGVQALLGHCFKVKILQFQLLVPDNEAATLFKAKMSRATEQCREACRLVSDLVNKVISYLRAALLSKPQSNGEAGEALDCQSKPIAEDEVQLLQNFPRRRQKVVFAAARALNPVRAMPFARKSDISGANSCEFTAPPLKVAV